MLGVNRRLLDDSEARVNLCVTFILLLFRNIIGRGRLILIDDVTVNVFLFTGSYSLFARAGMQCNLRALLKRGSRVKGKGSGSRVRDLLYFYFLTRV